MKKKAAPEPKVSLAKAASYRDFEIVSALLAQLPWTHHLIILGQSKHPEEREFYLRMAIREKWSSRELERHVRGAHFERTVPHSPKVAAALRQIHRQALNSFKDACLVEFLDLPADHSEADLNAGLLRNLGRFEFYQRLAPDDLAETTAAKPRRKKNGAAK